MKKKTVKPSQDPAQDARTGNLDALFAIEKEAQPKSNRKARRNPTRLNWISGSNNVEQNPWFSNSELAIFAQKTRLLTIDLFDHVACEFPMRLSKTGQCYWHIIWLDRRKFAFDRLKKMIFEKSSQIYFLSKSRCN
jgi:hypothetical protein